MHVLQGVDLNIGRGETVGCATAWAEDAIRTPRHVTQREGHIEFFGQDMSHARPHQVAHLGVAYVPEGRGMSRTCRCENLVDGLARACCDGRLGLDARAGARNLHAIAGAHEEPARTVVGRRDRCCLIGRALMTDLDLIILDEVNRLAPLISARSGASSARCAAAASPP